MNPPRIARRRGIFFAPMWIFAFLVLAGLVVALNVWRSAATTTFIVLRHAEKQLGSIDDPPLSADGLVRANRLAELLVTARSSLGQVQAVYASDTRRAEQTATPLAQRLGVAIQRYPARDIEALIDRIRTDHAGDVVLIVGHSNTVPRAGRRRQPRALQALRP